MNENKTNINWLIRNYVTYFENSNKIKEKYALSNYLF